MDSPKVSVIVPVFNSEDLLGNCLESIENQSLKDIEIICVDDGSSDGSFDILKQFSSKDARFKIYQQENSGAGFARNRGIEESSGEYILFVDSDDYIERETCEMLYEQASRLDCDLILFNSMRHFPNDRNLALIHFKKSDDINYQIRVFDYEYFRDRIFDGEYGVIWNKLYKSSFIRDNNIIFPGHKIYNDVEFHVAIVFFDVLYGIVDFLVEIDMFNEFRKEFINFTIFELRNKLKSIDEDSKQEFFEKTKEFYYFLELSSDEVNSIPYEYFMHFIFVVNSNDYEEFIKNE